MGKSEKSECTVPTAVPLRDRFTELHQRCLLWMNAQFVALEAFGQDFHDPPSIAFVLEAEHEIVREADDEATPPQARLHFVNEPFIQNVM